MDLIVDRTAWQKYLEENKGGFDEQLTTEPKRYPCFAYTVVHSVEMGLIFPDYLYANDLKRMLIKCNKQK